MSSVMLFIFQLINAMTNKLDTKDEPLPQDEAEGVDSDEWVCKNFCFLIESLIV